MGEELGGERIPVYVRPSPFAIHLKTVTALSIGYTLTQNTKFKKVNNSFHARFSAKGKTYIYKIRNSKISDPFTSDLEYTLGQKLDLDQMKEASKLFEGKHNFQNFTSKEEDDQKFSRNLGDFAIFSKNDMVEISITGDGFMRYMVRMIVGTLIEVGLGKLSIDKVKEYLESSNRNPVPYKAAPEGLYLLKVNY